MNNNADGGGSSDNDSGRNDANARITECKDDINTLKNSQSGNWMKENGISLATVLP